MSKELALTVDNAPRHAPTLAKLDEEKRWELYENLKEKAGDDLEPDEAMFRSMKAEAQAEALVDLLTAYDRACSGYAVVPVHLPLRVKRDSTNAKRWSEFAEGIETAMNTMMAHGYQQPQIMRFEDHGVLVVGFRPPPNTGPIAIMPMGAIPMGGMPTPERDPSSMAAEKHLHNLLMRSKAVTEMPGAGEEDFSKVMDEELRGCSAEDMLNMIETLDKHVTLHKERGGCGSDDCELLEHCARIRGLLEERVNLQLS